MNLFFVIRWIAPRSSIPFFAALTISSILFPAQAQPTLPLDQPAVDPGTTGSRFGASVAATAKRIYVGASHFNTNSRSNAGRVFMFDAKTLAPIDGFNVDAGSSAFLGSSLAASTKVVAAGAPSLKVGATFNAGGVLLYTEKTDSVTTISNPAPAISDNFGASVAASAKLLVIGAPGDAVGGIDGGSAFVVPLKTLVPQQLTMPDYADGDMVGTAVAISTKFIAVGAPEKTLGGFLYVGVVHIFDAKTLQHVITLQRPNGLSGGRFGTALAFAGSYLFVGAPAENIGFGTPDFHSGSGAVIQYDTRTWGEVRRIDAPTPQSFANFGRALATDKKRLFVGSYTYDQAATNDGMVQVFDVKTGAFLDQMNSLTPVGQGNLGISVAAVKGNRYVSGAVGEIGTSGQGTGRAYIRTLP